MKSLTFTTVTNKTYTIMLDKPDFYKYHGCKLRYYNNGGVCIMVERKAISLHRLIAGAKPGQFVKFVDGDRFNLTRENLKIMTDPASYSGGRERNPNSDGYSKYRGVYKRPREASSPTWYARVGKVTASGFTNEEEAARYADRLAKKQYGDDAILNFKEDE